MKHIQTSHHKTVQIACAILLFLPIVCSLFVRHSHAQAITNVFDQAAGQNTYIGEWGLGDGNWVSFFTHSGNNFFASANGNSNIDFPDIGLTKELDGIIEDQSYSVSFYIAKYYGSGVALSDFSQLRIGGMDGTVSWSSTPTPVNDTEWVQWIGTYTPSPSDVGTPFLFHAIWTLRANSSIAIDGPIIAQQIAPPPPADEDHFTWPVDPQNASNGHYGKCREWGNLSDGCYWLSDVSEDRSSVWIDVQPFQRHKWQGHGFHLGADYNFGGEPSDKGKPVYPVAKGTIPIGGVKTNQCGFGNIVFVRHEPSFGVYTSMYAHVDWLEAGPPIEGSEVSSDNPIAKIGNGYWNNRSCRKQKKGVWPYHLHFELREGDNIDNGIAYTGVSVAKGKQGQIDPNEFISTHR